MDQGYDVDARLPSVLRVGTEEVSAGGQQAARREYRPPVVKNCGATEITAQTNTDVEFAHLRLETASLGTRACAT